MVFNSATGYLRQKVLRKVLKPSGLPQGTTPLVVTSATRALSTRFTAAAGATRSQLCMGISVAKGLAWSLSNSMSRARSAPVRPALSCNRMPRGR